eukprot:UN29223
MCRQGHKNTKKRSMPAIRGLEEFLRNNGCVQERSLSALKNATVGVEGFQWLRSSRILKNDPLHSPLGGLPTSLNQSIKDELARFEKLDIKPLFVFGGLRAPESLKPPITSSRSRKYAERRHNAWLQAEKFKYKEAKNLFGQLSGYVSPQLLNNVIERLRRGGHNVMRSPSSSSAQLSYFDQLTACHTVFGGFELLLYGVKEVIISFDFKRNCYEFVDLNEILNDLALDFSAFLDSCLLSGFDVCRTFPPLLNTAICKKFSFEEAVTL